jgi:hypothetical protein
MSATKRCTKCGKTKPLTEFYRDSHKASGIRSYCKECGRKYKHDYYQKNREKEIEYTGKYRKEYDLTHTGHRKEYNSEYYQKHSDRWYEDYWSNPWNKRDYAREYRRSKKGKLYYVGYYLTHKENILEYQKKYRKTQSGKFAHILAQQKRRAIKKKVKSTLTTAQWGKILEQQGNRCTICHKKFTSKNPPTQDHIIPLLLGGPHTAENIQAVHQSCNSKKYAKLDPRFIQTWLNGI